MTRPIESLGGTFQGRACALVGKGPSLLHLREEHLAGIDVVLTINHAITKVRSLNLKQPVLMVWKDARTYAASVEPHPRYGHQVPVPCPRCPRGELCHRASVQPPDGTTELLLLHEHESVNCFPTHPQRYLFNNDRFGILWRMESIISALHIAHLLGVASLRFISFDASTNGDCRFTENGTTLHKKGDETYVVDVYMDQRQSIDATIGKLGFPAVEWITPAAP